MNVGDERGARERDRGFPEARAAGLRAARQAQGRARRRLGIGLLGVAALLTVWTVSTPSTPSTQSPQSPPSTQSPGAPAEDWACGPHAPTHAVPVSLPVASSETWRGLHGVLVCFTHDLVVTETFDLGRHGELLLADRRLYGDNTGLEVDDPTLHVIRLGARQRPATGEVWPLPWDLDVGNVRVGDAVLELVGHVWRSQAGGYVLEPQPAPVFAARNPRPAAPESLPGDLRIAAFNLDNFFLSVGERGADHPAALERQLAKLVAALAGLDADVVALSELERDGDGAALLALAAALNGHLEALAGDGDGDGVAPRRYLALPEAAASAARPGDAIRQGFLIDPRVVQVVALGADTAAIHERAPQALTLRHRASDALLTVIAVHLRSKSRCPTSGDVDVGFGCWNLRRSAQAEAILRFAGALVGEPGGADVLVLGDLNAHRFEPPLLAFEADGVDWRVLTDLVAPERAVSYVFFGRSAALDHAIASPALAPRVTGLTYWAINADEPPLAGPGRGPVPPPGYRKDPYRSSDHDPLVVGLQLGAPP